MFYIVRREINVNVPRCRERPEVGSTGLLGRVQLILALERVRLPREERVVLEARHDRVAERQEKHLQTAEPRSSRRQKHGPPDGSLISSNIIRKTMLCHLQATITRDRFRR